MQRVAEPLTNVPLQAVSRMPWAVGSLWAADCELHTINTNRGHTLRDAANKRRFIEEVLRPATELSNLRFSVVIILCGCFQFLLPHPFATFVTVLLFWTVVVGFVSKTSCDHFSFVLQEGRADGVLVQRFHISDYFTAFFLNCHVHKLLLIYFHLQILALEWCSLLLTFFVA